MSSIARIRAWLRKQWDRAQVVDFILGQWDRLPAPVRAKIWTSLLALAVLVISILSGVMTRASGFVVEYWAIAVIALLSGLGAGVLLAAPLRAMNRSLDRGVEAFRSRAGLAPSQPLHDADRRKVQDVRDLWVDYADHASRRLQSILTELIQQLQERRYWGELLQPIASSLESTRKEMEVALAPTAENPPASVYAAFNALHRAYYDGVLWLGRLIEHNDLPLDNEVSLAQYDRRLFVWMDQHHSFFVENRKVHNMPAHHGHILLYPNPLVHQFDQGYANLIGRIMARQVAIAEAVSLMPSMSDAEPRPPSQAGPADPAT